VNFPHVPLVAAARPPDLFDRAKHLLDSANVIRAPRSTFGTVKALSAPGQDSGQDLRKQSPSVRIYAVLSLFRFAPKATEVLRSRELTGRATSGHAPSPSRVVDVA